MPFQRLGLSVVMGLLIACPVGIATAQDEPPPEQVEPQGRPERGSRMQNPEFRQRMLEEFDKDGNGQLDDAERQAMREKMRERRAQMQERAGRGPDGPPPRGGRPDGPPPPRGDRRDGPDGPGARRGPGGPGGGPPGPGRDGPRRLEGLFEWFDGNHDNQLSREEFRDLSAFVHQRHHHGPPQGGPEGRGFGRRGPDGPPPGDGFGRGGPRGRRGPDDRPRRADGGGPPSAESPTPQPAEAAADDAA